MQPYSIEVKIHQDINRGIRQCSHKNLPSVESFLPVFDLPSVESFLPVFDLPSVESFLSVFDLPSVESFLPVFDLPSVESFLSVFDLPIEKQGIEGAGVLLMYETNVYLLERNPYYYKNDKHKHEFEYPGGKAIDGETPMETAIRETTEETGGILILNPDQLIEYTKIKSPQTISKDIYLYVVHLTDIQHNMIINIQDKLQSLYAIAPTKQETMNIIEVSLKDLINCVQNNILINGLELRTFNKYLLLELIKNKQI